MDYKAIHIIGKSHLAEKVLAASMDISLEEIEQRVLNTGSNSVDHLMVYIMSSNGERMNYGKRISWPIQKGV